MQTRGRLRLVTLLLGLVAGGAAPAGCHKNAPEPAAQGGPNADAVKQSFAFVRKQFNDLQQRSADLSRQIEAIPADLPGYPQLRASFYAFEEARGVTDAKVTLLSDRLDAALKSGNGQELQQVSTDIARAGEDARQIDQQYLKLLHGAMAFERVDDKRKEAVAASAQPPASSKHPKSKR